MERPIRWWQWAHVGRGSRIPRAVKKKDGELTNGPSEMLQRWHQHFSKLLNWQSNFDEKVIQQLSVVP